MATVSLLVLFAAAAATLLTDQMSCMDAEDDGDEQNAQVTSVLLIFSLHGVVCIFNATYL